MTWKVIAVQKQSLTKFEALPPKAAHICHDKALCEPASQQMHHEAAITKSQTSSPRLVIVVLQMSAPAPKPQAERAQGLQV